MPFIRCVYSGDASKKDELLQAISSAAVTALKKSEEVMCVHVECSDCLMRAGTKDPCAMINVEAIGGRLSDIVGPLTEILHSIAGVAPSRTFINFRDVALDAWGRDGVTVEEFLSRKK